MEFRSLKLKKLRIPIYEDTFISSRYSEENFSCNKELRLEKIDDCNESRVLIKFKLNLENINSVDDIICAKLRLNVSCVSSRMNIVKVCRNLEDFNYKDVCWKWKPNVAMTNMRKEISGTDRNKYIEINITELVKKWYCNELPNYGIQLVEFEYKLGLSFYSSRTINNPYVELLINDECCRKCEKGETGATGVRGEMGPVGATGIQGEKGPLGPTGSQGIMGPTGATGELGPTGLQGEKGPVGATGIAGTVGSTGATGAVVASGLQVQSTIPADGLSVVVLSGNRLPLDNLVLQFGSAVTYNNSLSQIEFSETGNYFVSWVINMDPAGEGHNSIVFLEGLSGNVLVKSGTASNLLGPVIGMGIVQITSIPTPNPYIAILVNRTNSPVYLRVAHNLPNDGNAFSASITVFKISDL